MKRDVNGNKQLAANSAWETEAEKKNGEELECMVRGKRYAVY